MFRVKPMAVIPIIRKIIQCIFFQCLVSCVNSSHPSIPVTGFRQRFEIKNIVIIIGRAQDGES
jgi:hypothetical protein